MAAKKKAKKARKVKKVKKVVKKTAVRSTSGQTRLIRSGLTVEGGLYITLKRRLLDRLVRALMAQDTLFDRWLLSRHWIVCLLEPTGQDSKPSLSVSRRDTVAWKNLDSKDREIRFITRSPLEDFPENGIVLAPQESSSPYRVALDAPLGKATYKIVPAFPGDTSGPPDEPVIIVET